MFDLELTKKQIKKAPKSAIMFFFDLIKPILNIQIDFEFAVDV